MTWWNQSTLNIYAVHTSPYDISAYHFHIQHRYTDTAWVTKRVSLLNTKEQVWPLHGAAALSKLLPAKKIFRHHVTAFGKFGQTRRDYFCAVIQAKCKKKNVVRFSLHQRQMNFEGPRAPHQSRLILRVQVFEHMFRDYHLERSAIQNFIHLCFCSKPNWRVSWPDRKGIGR